MTSVVKFAIIFTVEEEPKEVNPYQDPALIEQSRGDEVLLNRLVARQTATLRLQDDPENRTWKTMLEAVDTSVKDRQRQLGILPPEEEVNP